MGLAATAAAQSMPSMLEQTIRETSLHGSHLGVLVSDLPSGRVLYAHNADDAFAPASTLKLLTGATALETLGSNATFLTSLELRGRQQGQQFEGEVILHLGGDPLLTQADLRSAAQALVQRGISVIHGHLRLEAQIHEAQAYPEGWLLDDLPFDYAPPVPGIALDENIIHVAVTAARSVGAPATLTLSSADAAILKRLDLHVTNLTTTTATNQADTLAPWWGHGHLGVSGAVPLGVDAEDVSVAVPDASNFVLASLAEVVAQAGISLLPTQGVAVHAEGEQLVWKHSSPSLGQIVRKMWLRSDNFIAETLLEQLGAHHPELGVDPRIAGLAFEEKLLEQRGLDISSLVLNDGSGLSRYDLVTPRLYANLLAHLWASSARQQILNSLPLAGVRGTLAHAFRDTPIAGHYYAKTGGMRNVANLSGFLQTSSGHWLSVTILCDDAPIDDHELRTLQTRLLRQLIERDGAL